MGASIAEKAGRYLAEGRVKVQFVTEDGGLFHVTGSDPGDPYYVRFSSLAGWKCDCPARVDVCAHVKACQTITEFKPVESPAPVGFATQRDLSIDELLSGI